MTSKTSVKESVRSGYEKLGVEGYYKKHSLDYSNPHFNDIEYLLKLNDVQIEIGKTVLDLCCGSGEVTRILGSIKFFNVIGIDPYTAQAYRNNCKTTCLEYNFKDIACGALKNYKFDTIICSFALHLCEESMLNIVLYQLSLIAETLIIITPHKRPVIKSYWKEIKAIKHNKVTLKIYKRS